MRAAVVSILCNLPTGNRHFTLSLAMVNYWKRSTEGVSNELAVATSPRMPQSRRRLRLDSSRQPRKKCIGLHSQDVTGFHKHPERCSSWFSHFRQSESMKAIDLVLRQETRVTIGESMNMENLYNSPWGFVNKRGRSLRTDSKRARGGVAMLLNPYSSITEMVPWSEAH